MAMSDYISRDEIFSVWRSMPKPASVSSLTEAINRTPAAEVRAVRRGYWREDALNFSNGNYELECPFCECQMALNGCSKNQEYCPHCGEKLDFMRW